MVGGTKRARCLVGLVVVLTCTSTLPFLPGLSTQFIFDDKPAVLDNKGLLSDSPLTLFGLDFWGENITSGTSHKSYRPLTSLSLWLQAGDSIGPYDAAAMKLVNLCLNTANALLAYTLVYRLCRAYHTKQQLNTSNLACSHWLYSLSVTILFSIHPLHTEPVLTIVGRSDLLYSVLFLLCGIMTPLDASTACWFSFRWWLTGRGMLICLLTTMSMLCKEQGFSFFALLGIWQLLNLVRTGRRCLSWTCIGAIAMLCIIASLIAYGRLAINNFESPNFQAGDNPAAFYPHRATQISTFLYLYAFNAWLLICPAWLCFDWAMGCIPLVHLQSFPLDDWRYASILLFLLCVIGLVARAIKDVMAQKHNVLLAVALSMTVVPFLMCMNIVVRVGFVLAERNLYLPVLGYSLIYHQGMFRLAHHLLTQDWAKAWCRQFVFAMHVGCLTLLVARTALRSADWSSETQLYVAGTSVCPTNAKVYYNAAKKFAQSADRDMAKLCYKEAVRQESEFTQALNNLGNLLREDGNFQDAHFFLGRAVRVNPKFAAAHMNFAIVLQHMGKYEEAEHHYVQALNLRQPYPDCTFNLGNLYLKMKNYSGAEVYFRRGVEMQHQLSFVNLIILLNELDKLQEARQLAEHGLELFPGNPDFSFHLANTQAKLGRYRAAEQAYLTAIQLAPKSLYFVNLGVMYHRWGDLVKAKQAYETVLLKQPNNTKALQYLKAVNSKLESHPATT